MTANVSPYVLGFVCPECSSTVIEEVYKAGESYRSVDNLYITGSEYRADYGEVTTYTPYGKSVEILRYQCRGCDTEIGKGITTIKELVKHIKENYET